MSYTYLDSNAIQMREVIPFPAVGGLDLSTNKLNVHPGTLQSCMNYEVSKEAGYKLSPGLLRWNGTILYTLSRYLKGYINSDVAGSEDLYIGGEYTVDSEYTSNSIKLKILRIVEEYGYGVNTTEAYQTSDGEVYTVSTSGDTLIYFQILEGDWSSAIREGYSVDSGPYALIDNTVYGVLKE